MNYCKITSQKKPQMMPNPYHLTIANPTESQKKTIANMDGWLEMVYTDQPEYDPDTQYVTDYWVEESGKAVQHWEIHDIPEPEAEPEDYQQELERLGVGTDDEV